MPAYTNCSLDDATTTSGTCENVIKFITREFTCWPTHHQAYLPMRVRLEKEVAADYETIRILRSRSTQ